MKKTQAAIWGVVFLLTASLCGCEDQTATISPVRGRIYYLNRLLTRGTVVFTPDLEKGNHGESSTAEIGADGAYVLKRGEQFGASPGWHRVTVIAVEEPRPSNHRGEWLEPRSLIPEKYADPELADLSFEVLPGKANSIDIHLQ